MVKKSSAFFAIAILVFSFIFALLPPVHADNTNQEPLSAFYADMNGAASSYASLDYSTLHNGDVSIRVGPDYVCGTREVDGAWISIRPGDHIVLSCWIKTAAFTSSDPYPGALIGFDFDMSSSCGFGIATIDAEGHQAGHPNDIETVNDYSSWTGGPVLVPWGSDWTLVTWNFYVPTTYYTYVTCGGGALPTPNDVHPCDPVQINSMVVWFGQLDRTVNAYNWFADAQLYINPYCSPSPMIDNLVVLFSLLLNIDMILVFGFRGQRHTRSEAKLGTVSTLLLIPFTILWLLNLLSNSDLGRLITPFPVIILLAYDLWSRTATKRKPQHHPENWPLGRYIYLLLYIIGGIMLNGYAFLVSLPYGFVVLASFCGSLMAYGYYKYSQEKFKKSQNQQAIHNE